MSTSTRQEVHRLIDRLPDSLLADLLHWLQSRKLWNVAPSMRPQAVIQPRYTPVKLADLWQGISIDEQDIQLARQSIWAGFGESLW